MMLTVISPAKKLDYRSPVTATAHTQPALLKHSQELLEGLKKSYIDKTPRELERPSDHTPVVSEL